ncbi:MAG: hypothetical protein ACM30I_00415 [Gemmatimonas sp.]
MIGEVMWSGRALATIASTRHMPRVGTVEGWIACDATFRGRYERARAERRNIVADELRAAANDVWRRARTLRERIRAVRTMLGVAKWHVTTVGARSASSGAKESGATAEPGAKARAKPSGLTDAMAALLVETLDKAHAARKARAEERAKAETGDANDDARTAGDEARAVAPADNSSLPLPACGKRVGVRGGDDAGAPPHPPLSPETGEREKQTEPPPQVDKLGFPINRDPPDSFYPRFDVGGGFDVSNRRDTAGETERDYDPFDE